jgi:hypothetical protein
MNEEINKLRKEVGERLQHQPRRTWLDGVAAALIELADELEANHVSLPAQHVRDAAASVQKLIDQAPKNDTELRQVSK